MLGSFQILGVNQAVGGLLAASTPEFHATTFDGTLDYAGTSGVTFPALTPSSYQMTTINAPLALVNFQTSGNSMPLNPTVTINASVTENSAGNTQYQAATQGSAMVSVTYDYLPNATPTPVTPSAIPAGTYTIVPFATPGYADGKASSVTGKVATEFGEHVIVVNLTGAGSSQNNFGMLLLPKPTITHHDLPVIAGPMPTNNNSLGFLGNGNLFTVLDHHDW